MPLPLPWPLLPLLSRASHHAPVWPEQVTGARVYSKLKYESGVHRVQASLGLRV